MQDLLLPAAICATTALIGGLGCYFLTRHGKGVVSLIILVVSAALLFWLWLNARADFGWGGIGYAIVAILLVAPVLAGGLLGTVIGHQRRRRTPDK